MLFLNLVRINYDVVRVLLLLDQVSDYTILKLVVEATNLIDQHR
jgi:hypothetical protein